MKKSLVSPEKSQKNERKKKKERNKERKKERKKERERKITCIIQFPCEITLPTRKSFRIEWRIYIAVGCNKVLP